MKQVSFSQTNNTKYVSFSLPAKELGYKIIRQAINALGLEKNKVNNTKGFAVDVIDQTTNVLVVSEYPTSRYRDVKKSNYTNQQRSVTFIKPQDAPAVLMSINWLFCINQIGVWTVYKQLKSLKKIALYLLVYRQIGVYEYGTKIITPKKL